MSEQPIKSSNVPEFSVSELAFSLKRTLEENYSRVRVRGELSRVSIPKSGHMYSSLKDDKSVIDAICWKGVLSKLSIKPEEGLEVICVGRITTYPARSNYQLIIESMELAGEGALLKMLEERKKKLTAEGLFAQERKRPLPFLPQKIGVITSPTGAVIRDILHRLGDRFPRHVMVWPVKVQGEGADKEITTAINGFNALAIDQKPDLIIVARGGGSLEDLMPFNEEIVVRAAANSIIPIISAVGHETDTTLIDYASDLRAPTPTGAAEMAVPVRINLIAQIADDEKRLLNGIGRLLSESRHKMEALSAKLGDPSHLLEIKTQQVDRASDRLEHTFHNFIAKKNNKFVEQYLRLSHPAQLIKTKQSQLENMAGRTKNAFEQNLMKKSNLILKKSSRLVPPKNTIQTARISLIRWSESMEQSVKRTLENNEKNLRQEQEKLKLLSFENVLKRGYVVVRDHNDKPITQAKALTQGQSINLQFKDNQKIGAIINGDKKINSVKKRSSKKDIIDQGSLF